MRASQNHRARKVRSGSVSVRGWQELCDCVCLIMVVALSTENAQPLTGDAPKREKELGFPSAVESELVWGTTTP